MTQLGDFNFKDRFGGDDDTRLRNQLLGLAAVVVLVGLIALYWFMSGPDEAPVETASETPAAAPPPPPPPVEEPPVADVVELPPLAASDGLVRNLVGALSADPGLTSWLVTDRLVHRFVAFVDNVANENNPTQHVPLMRPDTRFLASGQEPVFRVDPRSYQRYDLHAHIIGSLDRSGTAELYRTLEPLLNDAYRELGYPDRPFRDALRTAIQHLLDCPVVDGRPELVRRGPFFHYTDRRLESLSPAQKQFLAMGPDNMRVVRDVLQDFAGDIGLDVR